MEYQRVVLESGLRIIHVPMPQVQSASFVVYVGVGSRYESEDEAGVCHLIEHMLFKGTETRPRARDISEEIESVGGVLNASTDKEVTVYWSKTAREHLPIAVDLISDMLLRSKLRPGDLAREKRIIAEELAMLADDPQDWIHVLTDELMWPRQALGREIAGSRESVSALSRRALLRYLERFYGPNNTVICVAGGVLLDDVVPLIQNKFGGWGGAEPSPAGPAGIPEAATRVRLEVKPNEHVNMCVAYPGMSRQNPDRWALDVLCTILGGGTSSRLFVELRERLGLVYDVHAYTSYFADTGSVVVYAGMDPAQSRRGFEAILRAVERVRARGITETELARAQRFFRGRLALSLEDTHSVASWFGGQEMLQHEVITPECAAEAVERVSAADVRRVARQYLDPAKLRLTAIGPDSGLELEQLMASA